MEINHVDHRKLCMMNMIATTDLSRSGEIFTEMITSIPVIKTSALNMLGIIVVGK